MDRLDRMDGMDLMDLMAKHHPASTKRPAFTANPMSSRTFIQSIASI
jgi:hypothetical protein